jgi:hypothetical protein
VTIQIIYFGDPPVMAGNRGFRYARGPHRYNRAHLVETYIGGRTKDYSLCYRGPFYRNWNVPLGQLCKSCERRAVAISEAP